MINKEDTNLKQDDEVKSVIHSTLRQIHRLIECDAVAYLGFSESKPETELFCVYPASALEKIEKLRNEYFFDEELEKLSRKNKQALLERHINNCDVFIHSSSTNEHFNSVILGIIQRDKQTQYIKNKEVLNTIVINLSFVISNQLKLAQVQENNIQLVKQNINLSQKLRDNKEELQSALNAKAGFWVTINHELRTPLNGVLGMLHLLGDSDLDSTQMEYVKLARQSGESLLEIINDALDLSLIETGNLEIKKDKLLLWDAIESVVSEFSDEARSKGLELSCYLAYDVPFTVSGDDKRIKQLLVNLIGNAIKFTDSGEVALFVTVDSIEDSIALLRFRVRDTGIGVKQESIEDILNKQDTGAGLGLMICSRLVQAMGGEIGVDSIANNGSVFWFTLEMEIVANDVRFIPNTILEAKRALIVDDRASSAAVVQHRLIDWGLEAHFVSTAKHAIQFSINSLKENKPFDIIFINLDLDKESASELITELDVVHSKTSVVFIGMTNSIPSAIKSESKNLKQFIKSPIQYKQLHDSMVLALDGSEYCNIETESPENNKQFLSGAQILIVEGNIVDQKVAAAILKKFGCVCDFADSCAIAIEKVKRLTFNAILMDYHSFITDGFQTIQKIREIESASEIPIIALASHTLNNVKKECIESGMNDCLSKPINPRNLYSKLSNYISQESTVNDQNPKDQEYPATHLQHIDNNDGLNHEVLDKLHLLLGKEAFKGLIDSYILRATTHIQSARQHIELNDMEQLHFVAHTLKGSSANLGVSNLAALSASLDDMALQTSPIPELYQQLEIIEKQFETIEILLLKNLKKRVS